MSAHANVIISNSTASEFLESSEQVLEDLASKYYEIAINSSEYTGFTQNVTLIKFFSDYVDTFKEPVAILGGVNSGKYGSNQNSNSSNGSNGNNSTNNNNDENSNGNNDTSTTNTNDDKISSSRNFQDNENAKDSNQTVNKDSNYKAGETPITSKANIENMGLAVFKEDNLVGELTGIETIYHLIVSNSLKSCNIRIPNPLGDSENLDINVKLARNTQNNVNIVNGSPYISTKIHLEIQIISTTEQSSLKESSYYTKENTKLIEETCNKYLSKQISAYLYKTSKQYKADIDGFGKHAVKYFLTLQDWNKYNWLNSYEDSIFNVDINSTLKSGYTFL